MLPNKDMMTLGLIRLLVAVLCVLLTNLALAAQPESYTLASGLFGATDQDLATCEFTIGPAAMLLHPA